MTDYDPLAPEERRKPRPEELSRLERLDAQLSLAQTGSWEMSASGGLWLSPSALALLRLGHDRAPATAEALFELSPEEDQPALRSAFERAIERRGRLEIVQRVVFPDGEAAYFSHRAETLTDQLGAVRLCGVVSDVTRTREMSERLALSETLLEIAGRVARLGGWSVDLEQGRVHWSDEVCRIHQVEPGSSVTVEQALDFYEPRERELVARAFERCAQMGEPFDLEARVTGALGEARLGRVIGRARRDERGRVIRVEGAFHDITDQRRAQSEARALSTRLSSTLETMKDAFVTMDERWRLTYMNRQTERALGLRREEALGASFFALFPEAQEGSIRESFERALATRSSAHAEGRLSGRCFETRSHFTPEGLAVYFHDITSQREEREQLELLKNAVERVNDILLIVKAPDAHTPLPVVVFANQACSRLLGAEPSEIIGQPPLSILGAQGESSQIEALAREARAGRGSRAELSLMAPDGSQVWLDADVSPILNAKGALTHWVAVQRDVTERKLAQQEIEHLAFFDQLTGLPNRALLMQRLSHALAFAESERSNQRGALLFIDLDNFKAINDTLGHDKGDALLVQAAERLKALAPEPDLVARVGGDEFVALLENLPSDPLRAAAAVKSAAEAMLRELGRPYELCGLRRRASASIGAALFDESAPMGELLQRADLAMYQAKAHGGGCVRFFDPQTQAALLAREALEAELREGLRAREFELWYQPQVGRDGRLIGAEALARWRRGSRAPLSPSEFIPLAEETGLIIPLGRWALESACDQLARWATIPSAAGLSISVNVSPIQFRQPDFVDTVKAALRRSGANPSLLKLELTETVMVHDQEAAIAKMQALRDLGARFSLDDFGTGYSSLSYLRRLPLAQVKIDQSFVRDALTRPADAAIAQSIISLCQSLQLEPIAEGVETEEQRAFLLSCGCELYQGFLFGRPMAPEAFERLALLSCGPG